MKQFGCFQLDTRNECLWQNGTRIGLTPKPFAVLRYLVENPQRLVTHDELLDKLWPETYVQPQVLRTYVLELRKLLGDSVENPRFIRTVPGRGYWFLALVEDGSGHAAESPRPRPQHQPQQGPQQGHIVGRQQELQRLNERLGHATQGDRQVILLSGETGIGKTALIDLFCRQWCSEDQVCIARSQCVEGFAGKEAYYPVIEALGQLCSPNEGQKYLHVMQQRAPSWYAQFAALRGDGPAPMAGRGERTLNEICDAIEAMASDKTLVFVFEDLHWADLSTLDLISALARRRQASRLLLLSSYRPAEVSAGQHPLKRLKQDLVTHKLCADVPLGPLGRDAVRDYLIQELNSQALGGQESNEETLPKGLASFVHQHCEGNPLFMIAMLEHLIGQGFIRQEGGVWQLSSALAEIDPGVPTALSEMIEMQIDRLDAADQRLLEAASLIGVIFPAWAAAAALDGDLEDIEDQYEKLTRRLHFLHPAGHDELPDGTQSAFYVFAHGLYREVLRARQSPARRARRHLRVAEKLEKLFAGRELDVSSELAMHFEAAAEWARASQALCAAAGAAMRRGARDEGVKLTERALRLLENLSEPERQAAERKTRQQIAGVMKH
ncbi:MAG TPA: AAA family ATPase [Acidobacteriaceae bacterium]|jgi:predicted ATPase|nr:AAA family ATPase [Acidobacteriaceae bacterium]